jgi:hypothetical protein
MSGDNPQPKLLPLAEQLTPADREAYERDCLDQLRRAVEHSRGGHYYFLDVTDLRLDGSYPETAIAIQWKDTRSGRAFEHSYNLWISPVTGEPGQFEYRTGRFVGREPPSEVALLIHTYVQGG